MVVTTHTIVYPVTMMIKTVNTLLTDVAMSGSLRGNYFTFRAQIAKIQGFNQFLQGKLENVAK